MGTKAAHVRVRFSVCPTSFEVKLHFADRKLYLDFMSDLSLSAAMTLDEDEIGDLPHRLFAMAGRSLERATAQAGAGEAKVLSPLQRRDLAGELHCCGQDLMVIADAIAAITREITP